MERWHVNEMEHAWRQAVLDELRALRGEVAELRPLRALPASSPPHQAAEPEETAPKTPGPRRQPARTRKGAGGRGRRASEQP